MIEFCKRLPWRVWLVTLVLLVFLVFVVHLIRSQGYWLTYQTTPSMPQGWYWVMPAHFPLKRHAIVVFKPPKSAQHFLIRRGWLPQDGYMMKYVIGVPGDFACNRHGVIRLNHKVLGLVKRYTPQQHIQLWTRSFCGVIKLHHYLLMHPGKKRSYDGRYFGSVARGRVVGVAYPLWTSS